MNTHYDISDDNEQSVSQSIYDKDDLGNKSQTQFGKI